jgi:hypothetical protein
LSEPRLFVSAEFFNLNPTICPADDGTNRNGDDLNQPMFYTSPRPWVFDIPKMFSDRRHGYHHSPPFSSNDDTSLDLAQI